MVKYYKISFVSPQNIDAENAQNYHLFEGYCDSQGKHFIPFNGKSCCGKCHCSSSGDYEIIFERPGEDSRMSARRLAKEYEDSGKKVCGQCVAKLFSDGI